MFPLRSLVESQFNGPRPGRAVLFFLLPYILWAAFLLTSGFALNVQGIGLSALIGAASWVAVSAVLFLLLKAFKGKDVQASFTSVLAAFSVSYLIAAAAGLVVFALTFLSIPGLFQKLASLQGQSVTFGQMVSVVESLPLPPDAVLLAVFALIGILALGAAAAGVYVIYRIGQLGRETSRFSNLVFTVLALGIILGTNLALGAIIGYFL